MICLSLTGDHHHDEQVLSFLRTIVQTGAAALGAKGYIDTSGEQVLTAFVVWLIPTLWGLYVRRKAGLVASAAGLPEVCEIRTTPEIADALPDPTVTAR